MHAVNSFGEESGQLCEGAADIGQGPSGRADEAVRQTTATAKNSWVLKLRASTGVAAFELLLRVGRELDRFKDRGAGAGAMDPK